jgi:hypothetical protein
MFGSAEAKHEIFGEPLQIALNSLIQPCGGDAVHGGEVPIKDDAPSSQAKDCARDALHVHWFSMTHK